MNNLGNKEIMAKNIKYYMELHGKSRNEICEALGVKYTTFSDWVRGNSYPRIDKIEMLANYFGIEKSDLVEDKRRNNKTDSINDLIEKQYGSDVLEVISLYIQLDALSRGAILERIRIMLENKKRINQNVDCAKNNSVFYDFPDTPEEFEKDFPQKDTRDNVNKSAIG